MKEYKSALYGAVIYSVITGAIYVTLAVLALLARWCVVSVDASPFLYMLYLLFFRVESCEQSIRWEALGIPGSDATANMPAETEAVTRTFIFAIVYLGLHAALVFTALCSLCGINNSCLGRRSFGIFFAPWIVVLVAIIVLDVMGVVIYSIYAVNASTDDGLMDILEIANPLAVFNNFAQVADHVKLLPSIVMAIVAGKLFFFLIANVVYVVVITRAGWSASTYHKYVDQTRRNYESTMSRTNPGFEGSENNLQKQPMGYVQNQGQSQSPQPVTPIETAEHRYKDPARTTQVYPYHMQQRKEEDFKIQRPVSEQINSQPNNVNNEPDIIHRFSRYPENESPQTISSDVPEQQQSNTRVRVLPSVIRPQSDLRPRPTPPPKPQNNRYTMQPSPQEAPVQYRNPTRVQSAKVDRTSSQLKAPEGLKNQLPWSYLQPREDAPRKAFSNLDEREELPSVPNPDYTLHYPPKKRGNLSDSDNSDSWAHQRY